MAVTRTSVVGGRHGRGRGPVVRGVRAALGLVLLLACREAPAPELPLLRIGTSGDYAPFSVDGHGFDIEVAGRLARDLGYRVEWVPFRWSELREAMAAGRFDLAMSGVTWQPERDVIGWSSRAVAAGGPCLVGRGEISSLESAPRVGVNRGGFLERWAREHLGSRVQAVDENRALPGLLARGELDAIVTDRFELASFVRDLAVDSAPRVECQPARYRKVYWITPPRAAELGPAVDAWLAAHEPELQELRERSWGERDPRGELDHLVDLLARRLAFAPFVAAAKRERGLPIEDLAQEARVLDASGAAARARGLDPASFRELFRVQIELSKAMQERAAAVPASLELDAQMRPALGRLGERIADSLAALAPIADPRLRAALAGVLGGESGLQPTELAALESALRRVQRAQVGSAAQPSEAVDPR
jgi:cyclohexadienyl dehydratase